ncbi:hypothetical protein PPTG_23597 [Phytophthora nicotianae INRA-310]|uniref:Uncharacterized protein n=1 Tax=Phytophthora nicotianae (strain INRA-310) TaxID=761204 RepID=W2PVP5_PHYN3|nr:hypothetical protein PPTG_23597 [Phytophthora nicotianae INRA-310]ETN04274.1 hypothetical protein PPTG_23597 [Phytophthora nicotianae INRA-310]
MTFSVKLVGLLSHQLSFRPTMPLKTPLFPLGLYQLISAMISSSMTFSAIMLVLAKVLFLHREAPVPTET